MPLFNIYYSFIQYNHTFVHPSPNAEVHLLSSSCGRVVPSLHRKTSYKNLKEITYDLGIHILWKASSLSQKVSVLKNLPFPLYFSDLGKFFVFWEGGGWEG
jgi:hypothetical protein